MSALSDYFTSLATKIRSKTGSSATMTPTQMVNAVDDVYLAGKAHPLIDRASSIFSGYPKYNTGIFIYPEPGRFFDGFFISAWPFEECQEENITKSRSVGTIDSTGYATITIPPGYWVLCWPSSVSGLMYKNESLCTVVSEVAIEVGTKYFSIVTIKTINATSNGTIKIGGLASHYDHYVLFKIADV